MDNSNYGQFILNIYFYDYYKKKKKNKKKRKNQKIKMKGHEIHYSFTKNTKKQSFHLSTIHFH